MNDDLVTKVLAMLILIALVVGVCVGYGVLFYGDWRCGFAHCTRIK